MDNIPHLIDLMLYTCRNANFLFSAIKRVHQIADHVHLVTLVMGNFVYVQPAQRINVIILVYVIRWQLVHKHNLVLHALARRNTMEMDLALLDVLHQV